MTTPSKPNALRSARKPKKRPQKRPREENSSAPKVPVPSDPDMPLWIPTDYNWEKFPQKLRDAVLRIVAPAYRRFVLDAPGELERSVGLTHVHLMWLEICGQIQLAVATADPDSLDAILKNPEDMLDRHLRLATVKCQTAELLMKLQIVQAGLQRPPATQAALPSPVNALTAIPCPAQPAPLPRIAEVLNEPENGNLTPC